MTPNIVVFTQAHAETLATLDEKVDHIYSRVDEIKEHMEKCYFDLECRTRTVEKQVEFERGRLAVIFIAIGAGISAVISWVMNLKSGGG